MVEHGVYFLDDLTKISVAGTLWSFAFAYFAELLVLAALFASSRRRVGRSRLHRPLNGSFLFIIPLQVWALQASCRAIAFYDMLGWSHGPAPLETSPRSGEPWRATCPPTASTPRSSCGSERS